MRLEKFSPSPCSREPGYTFSQSDYDRFDAAGKDAAYRLFENDPRIELYRITDRNGDDAMLSDLAVTVDGRLTFFLGVEVKGRDNWPYGLSFGYGEFHTPERREKEVCLPLPSFGLMWNEDYQKHVFWTNDQILRCEQPIRKPTKRRTVENFWPLPVGCVFHADPRKPELVTLAEVMKWVVDNRSAWIWEHETWLREEHGRTLYQMRHWRPTRQTPEKLADHYGDLLRRLPDDQRAPEGPYDGPRTPPTVEDIDLILGERPKPPDPDNGRFKLFG